MTRVSTASAPAWALVAFNHIIRMNSVISRIHSVHASYNPLSLTILVLATVLALATPVRLRAQPAQELKVEAKLEEGKPPRFKLLIRLILPPDETPGSKVPYIFRYAGLDSPTELAPPSCFRLTSDEWLEIDLAPASGFFMGALLPSPDQVPCPDFTLTLFPGWGGNSQAFWTPMNFKSGAPVDLVIGLNSESDTETVIPVLNTHVRQPNGDVVHHLHYPFCDHNGNNLLMPREKRILRPPGGSYDDRMRLHNLIDYTNYYIPSGEYTIVANVDVFRTDGFLLASLFETNIITVASLGTELIAYEPCDDAYFDVFDLNTGAGIRTNEITFRFYDPTGTEQEAYELEITAPDGSTNTTHIVTCVDCTNQWCYCVDPDGARAIRVILTSQPTNVLSLTGRYKWRVTRNDRSTQSRQFKINENAFSFQQGIFPMPGGTNVGVNQIRLPVPCPFWRGSDYLFGYLSVNASFSGAASNLCRITTNVYDLYQMTPVAYSTNYGDGIGLPWIIVTNQNVQAVSWMQLFQFDKSTSAAEFKQQFHQVFQALSTTVVPPADKLPDELRPLLALDDFGIYQPYSDWNVHPAMPLAPMTYGAALEYVNRRSTNDFHKSMYNDFSQIALDPHGSQTCSFLKWLPTVRQMKAMDSRGACYPAARINIALARALGIPARFVMLGSAHGYAALFICYKGPTGENGKYLMEDGMWVPFVDNTLYTSWEAYPESGGLLQTTSVVANRNPHVKGVRP